MQVFCVGSYLVSIGSPSNTDQKLLKLKRESNKEHWKKFPSGK